MAKKITKNKTVEKAKEKLKPPSKTTPKVVPKATPKPAPKVASKVAPKPVPKTSVPKNVIVSYNKISDELKLELIKKYPDGYTNYVHRYPRPNGEFFFAIPLDVGDMHYMIKVEVKVDNLITEDEFDKHFGDISEVDGKTIGDVGVDDDNDDTDTDADDVADDSDDDDDDDDDDE